MILFIGKHVIQLKIIKIVKYFTLSFELYTFTNCAECLYDILTFLIHKIILSKC